MIKNLMSILILTLCLSHCTTTDFINVGAAFYTYGMGAIKLLKKKDNNDKAETDAAYIEKDYLMVKVVFKMQTTREKKKDISEGYPTWSNPTYGDEAMTDKSVGVGSRHIRVGTVNEKRYKSKTDKGFIDNGSGVVIYRDAYWVCLLLSKLGHILNYQRYKR